MTKFAPPRRQQNDLMATARPLPFCALLALSVLTACAGDLDPRYGTKGGVNMSTGSGGAPGTTGSGGAPASTGSGGAPTASGSGGGAPVAAACTYAQTSLLARCGSNGCHGPNGIPPNLASDTMAASIIGEGAATPCAGTSTTALIDSKAPLAGVLLTRITSSTCGPQMPFGGGSLSQAELDCIKSYFLSKIQ